MLPAYCKSCWLIWTKVPICLKMWECMCLKDSRYIFCHSLLNYSILIHCIEYMLEKWSTSKFKGGLSKWLQYYIGGALAKWLQYNIGAGKQMVTVLHRGGLANDYSIPWILGYHIRNIISKDFSVSKKSVLGVMSKWLQLYIGGVRPNDYSIT